MNFAVLIATRNRPEQLNTLLISLRRSAKRISQVTVVSSGIDVSSVVNSHQTSIPINYFNSEISGQIAQKIKGIELIPSSTQWVMFLDDDVVIPEYSIDNLIDNYLTNSDYKDVAGFGLNLNNIELRRPRALANLFLKIVGLYSGTPGTILKSGHAEKYLGSKEAIYTQWLNGLSVWRYDLLKNYNPKFSRIDYAAYEDVLFSYRVSKQHKLLFTNDVSAYSQTFEKFSSLSARQFKAAAYMRFLFVAENQELSKFLMLFAQIFRTLDFIFGGDQSLSILNRSTYSLRIYIDLVFSTFIRIDPIQLLNKRYT
jgi:GT2 family glycosyltransferase